MNDILFLGPVSFDDFSTPADMCLGGSHNMTVHKMPGGARTIHMTGPDDEDRTWSGTFLGEDAETRAVTLYQMMRSGSPLPLSWGFENRVCVISKFSAKVQRWGVINYSITVVLDDDGDDSSVIPLVGSLVASDLASALSSLQS